MKKRLKIVLFIAWLLLIHLLSLQNGKQSSDLSNSILIKIAFFFKIADLNYFVVRFGFLIRKLAHFSEYFILYILTYECFKEFHISNLELKSILFCILYALFDEFCQLFVDGRCGQLFDVMIDTCGILFSYFVWLWLKK